MQPGPRTFLLAPARPLPPAFVCRSINRPRPEDRGVPLRLLAKVAGQLAQFMQVNPNPGASLLVVDDDPDLREALEELLLGAGLRVSLAVSGADALRQLRQGLRVDLVLLDLHMPEMDGWAFRVEQLRDSRLAQVP